VAQPRIGFLAVGFGRFYQAVKLCAGSGTFGRVTEQPVLSPDDKRADRTLGRVVVHRQVAVLDVAFQFAPVAGQVTDGLAQGILRRDLRLRFLYPVFQLSQQWQAALHAGNLTIFVVTVLQVALGAIELIDQVQCDVSASCFALGLYFLRFDELAAQLMAFGGALLGGGLGAKGGKAFDARYEIRSHGFGSNLGNIKVVRRAAPPPTPKKGISPQLCQKLRAKTPSKEIQAMVNKDVVLPMKDPALPGLEVTKPLHADHIVPMKTITEMKRFDKLTFEQQGEILNYKPSFHGLSETANTSRGAKTYSEWAQYKKVE